MTLGLAASPPDRGLLEALPKECLPMQPGRSLDGESATGRANRRGRFDRGECGGSPDVGMPGCGAASPEHPLDAGLLLSRSRCLDSQAWSRRNTTSAGLVRSTGCGGDHVNHHPNVVSDRSNTRVDPFANTPPIASSSASLSAKSRSPGAVTTHSCSPSQRACEASD